jgi:hypothetical protein
MWYRRRWIIFGYEICLEIKEASSYLIRKNWKAIRKAEKKIEPVKVYSFMEHFVKFPELYLTAEEYKKYFPGKEEKMDKISNQMADAVVELDNQGKIQEVYLQSPEVTGRDECEVTTPVVI